MRKSLKDKQNTVFHSSPRYSLNTADKSKRKMQITQGRLSMLPIKRQRLSIALETPLTQSKPLSALRNNINILNNTNNNSSLITSSQRSIKKQTIMNNLVNKLDEQQEIRTIIQTKLRRNSYGANKDVLYTSEFQPYLSNHTMNLNNTQKNMTKHLSQLSSNNQKNCQNNVSLKLQKCQQQIKHFKQMIQIMSEKMKIMQKQSQKNNKYKLQDQEQNKTCQNCKCTNRKNEKKQVKIMKQIWTQTNLQNYQKNNDKFDFDFLQNLDKTLKVLNSGKKIK